MRNTIVRCGQCSGVLNIPGGTGAGAIDCRFCGAPTRLWLFPALYRAREGAQALAEVDDGMHRRSLDPGRAQTERGARRYQDAYSSRHGVCGR